MEEGDWEIKGGQQTMMKGLVLEHCMPDDLWNSWWLKRAVEIKLVLIHNPIFEKSFICNPGFKWIKHIGKCGQRVH